MSENLVGGNQNDVIYESATQSLITGGFGNDEIHITVGGEGD